MSQSTLQTQCPNCETRFRVTDEQLSIARGKVRCGSCMKVFNAVEHQVSKTSSGSASGESTPKEPPTPGATSPASGSDSGTTEEDFVFADNPEEDATEGRYAGTSLTFSADELSDSFRGVDKSEKSGYHHEDPTSEKPAVDESWAEAMLSDDQPKRSSGQPEASEPTPQAPKPPSSADQSARTSQGTPAPDDELTLAATEADRAGRAPDQRPRQAQTTDTQYRDLRRDPVAVGNGKSGLRTALWTLVVLALLGILVAQVTWFQFDRLSAIPQLRPFYEKGCELAGCQLKPLINVDAIQSRKLVVRTDPENRNQLIVDAVIINRAGFEQPFPAIALTFSNLNGDVVAQSTFMPEEYLAGDAETLDIMPSETPVRIAISIRDPGRDAVNYNLNFRPWTP
ncbi:MAG: DUF3426 domain-containing protein [Marinobacter sp.]